MFGLGIVEILIVVPVVLAFVAAPIIILTIALRHRSLERAQQVGLADRLSTLEKKVSEIHPAS